MAATAYIVDDDSGFRDSLSFLVNSVDIPSQEFASAEDFIEQYDGKPGCLLLDIRMDGMSGLDLQQELAKLGIHLPVIILTGHGDVPLAVTAMKNGAVDFLEKPFDGDQLIEKIRAAIKQSRAVSRDQKKRQQHQQLWQELSKREKEVYELLVQGLSNKDMADILGISVRTLEVHRLRVLKKMEVKNAVELSQKAELL